MAYGDPKKKEKPDAVLATALGGAPRSGGMGREPMPPGEMGMSEGEEGPSDVELPPDFVDYAELAFPELTGDIDRLTALKHMVEACVKSGY